MHPQAMLAKMGHITLSVRNVGGVSEAALEQVLRSHGVSNPGAVSNYKAKLTQLGFLVYCPDRIYRVTSEGATAQEIWITVRSAPLAEPFRQHIMNMLAPYSNMIEVSEVHDVGE